MPRWRLISTYLKPEKVIPIAVVAKGANAFAVAVPVLVIVALITEKSFKKFASFGVDNNKAVCELVIALIFVPALWVGVNGLVGTVKSAVYTATLHNRTLVIYPAHK